MLKRHHHGRKEKKQRHGDTRALLWPLGQEQGCSNSGTVLVVGAEHLPALSPHSRQNNNPILC